MVGPGSIVSGPQVFLGRAEVRFRGGKRGIRNAGIGFIDEGRRRRQQKDADERGVLGVVRKFHHGERVRCGARSCIRARLPFRQSGQRSGGLGDEVSVEESGKVGAEQGIRVRAWSS